MHNAVCYSGGSNFAIDRLSAESPLICGHKGTNNIQGEVQVIVCYDAYCISGSPCNSTTKPIQCSHNDSTILLRPSNSNGYSGSNMTYKCYNCDDNTNATTVNVQGKCMWIL